MEKILLVIKFDFSVKVNPPFGGIIFDVPPIHLGDGDSSEQRIYETFIVRLQNLSNR